MASMTAHSSRGKRPLWARLSLAALLGTLEPARALADAGDAFQLFQEEAKVVIATQKEQMAERAPSIVSVITRQEIEAYGARDLADILCQVPGFEFGVDVFGIAGLSFRGVWVHEGKSLLMIDGIAQNELGYGNYNFFGSIPASMIERVEIIRGPGSAVYGGFAEVDAINVITHQAASLSGIRVSGDAGAASGGASRRGNVSFGTRTDSLRLAGHIGYGTEPLSGRVYEDFSGNRLKLDQETAYRRWQHVVAEASTKNLTVRHQRNTIEWGGQDAFTTIDPPVNGVNLDQLNNYNDVTHVDYKAKVSDRWTLQPLFEYTRNNTFSFNNPAAIDGNFEGSGSFMWRYKAELAALYEGPGTSELRLGGGYIRDDVQSVVADGTPGLQLSAGPGNLATRAHTSSTFGLFQYVKQIRSVGLTLGGRYEDTSFGNAFAPRAGLTYVHDAFNGKLLYGRAFRIPLPWQAFSRQFGFSGGLRPETADTTEMEFGYKLAPRVAAKLNTFFIDIRRPIVYQGNTNTYANFGRIQSEGVEAELRADYARCGGFANASYAAPGNATSLGFTTRSKKQFLASPPLKANVGAYYKVGRFELSPSATFLSHRAGQSRESALDPMARPGTTDYKALVLANFNIVWRDVVKDLDVHLGVHNAFDARYMIIQPYYGDHAPMPAQDRVIELGATWRL